MFLLTHFKQNPRQFQTVRFSFDYFKQGVGTAQRYSVCHVYLYVRKHNMLNHLMSKVTGTEVNICSFIVSRLRTAAKTTFQLLCYSLLSCLYYFSIFVSKTGLIKNKNTNFLTVIDVPLHFCHFCLSFTVCDLSSFPMFSLLFVCVVSDLTTVTADGCPSLFLFKGSSSFALLPGDC